YADFTYYRDIFSGILITDEAMFRTFAERASEFIDTATFDRLADEELLNHYKTKIQKCVCALAEQFFKRNTAVSADFSSQENMPKTSESIGSYSVSFVNPLDYVQEISMTDSDFQKSLKSTVLRCLGNTGLLYRGVD
ncbi:MAG: hypothetical protein K2N27_05745, partial [Ruminococcus sp.]|nr:hypothetical protein [Ruminococcus sp.]